MQQTKFQTIQGARAVLACWIFAHHLLWCSGFTPENASPWFYWLFSDGYRVDVFMLISGFGIAHLLESRKESYGRFIFRRFMRLYPLYFATLLIGIYFFAGHWGNPQAGYKGSPIFHRSPEAYEHWAMLFGAHFSMLHGLIPNSFIPTGPLALNVPTWTVSLEWQFYLLAPFLLALTRYKKGIPLIFVTLAIMHFRPNPPAVSHGAFLMDRLEFFVLGCLSRTHFETIIAWIRKFSVRWIWGVSLIPFVWIVWRQCDGNLFNMPRDPWIPLWIWMWLGILLLMSREVTNPEDQSGILFRFLAHPWMQYLGRISYSMYLLHYLFIQVWLEYFSGWLAQFSHAQVFWISAAVLTPPIILASEFTNRFIEGPGIRLGKEILHRRNISTTPSPLPQAESLA